MPADDLLDDDLGKNYKDVVANAVSSVYWERLLLQLSRRAGVDEVTMCDTIADRLAVDSATVFRWYQGTTFVQPGKFFVSLVAFNVELASITFDKRQDVIRKTVRRLVDRVRMKNLRRNPDRRITDDELKCVKSLFEHKYNYGLMFKYNNELRQQVIASVAGQLSMDADTVTRIYEEWYRAYAIYALNRPPTWDFLCEI